MAKKPPKAADPDLSRIAEGLRPLAVPIADLVLQTRNPVTHSGQSLEAIKASYRQFGQVKPLVVNQRNREVVAGNGQLQAARQLGWTHLAVTWLDLTDSQQAALAVADNRSAQFTDWDSDVLSALLDDIRGLEGGPGLADALLLDDLLGPADEEPAGQSEAVASAWKIVVECRDEAHQKRLFEELQGRGEDVRLLTT